MERTNDAVFSQVDLRGFSYPLEPYLRKQEWQLERLEGKLAQVQKQLLCAQDSRRGLHLQFEGQARQMLQWTRARLDPHMHQRGLAYLADVRQRIETQDQEIQSLHAQKASLHEEFVAQQRTIDGLQEHRSIALQEYAQEVTRVQAAEADRDWIGRIPLRARQRPTSGEVAP
ncbi:hypothetical protein M4R22_19560 [Acidovorax sp. GBBC 3334]|uniref:hypothetical protein n=1 Tax=Acidovorax sp. GBBC 3334 TaxID=2940496 RepID=UPI00230355B5|nr:hypothetical protein [Acidovorax sp. GBBC 3334]MDA8456961.1 hypothetical protein [Acidovorax sp. GBBC 3334]